MSTRASFLELELSRCCNLACKYCYEQHYLKEYSDDLILSYEDAKQMIFDYYKQIKHTLDEGQTCHVELFGGEPLLAMDTIKQLLKDNEVLSVAHFSLITNCTIYDEELTDLFIKNSVTIEFSLDPPRTHAEQRVWRHDGSSSYIHCWKTFEKYLKHFKNSKYNNYRVRVSFIGDGVDVHDVTQYVIYLLMNGFPITMNLITTHNNNTLPADKYKTLSQFQHILANVRAMCSQGDLLPMFVDENTARVCGIDCLGCTAVGCEDSLVPTPTHVPCFERFNKGVFDDDSNIEREISFTKTKYTVK